jgi:hypothetical protein
LGNKDRPPLALRLACQVRGRVFQPRERTAARIGVAEPAHHADMVLPEAVAQDGFGGIDVDLVALQQGPDAGCSGRAEVTEPVLLLGFVGGHELFRHLVDVGGGGLGDAEPSGADDRCVVGLLCEFVQAPALEPGRADAVGPQQRGHGDAALGQPAGVLLGGRGDVDVVQVDAALEDVEHGGHVLGDAGFQQGEDPAVGAQLGDFPDDEGVDVRRHLGAVGGKRAGDVGGALGNGWTCLIHGGIVRRLL